MSGPPARSDAFEDVDWQTAEGSGRRLPRWNTLAFLAGVTAIGYGAGEQFLGAGSAPVVGSLEPLDWLTAVSLLALGAFVAVPLARTPRATRRFVRRLARRRVGLVSFLYVLGFLLVGLVGPLFVSEPELSLRTAYQPPVGATVDSQFILGDCAGKVAGGKCHGTWRYPLGTTKGGKDMLSFVVLGTRTALQVALVSATFIVPTGVGVGLVAAFAGGTVDDVLMRAAEVLQTVPAVLVYILFWQWNADYRLLMLILVFGATSWGGLARLVRNETLQRREELYVQAARGAGADDGSILRRHLLPNVSGSVLTNVTLQIPLLVLTEAALSFIVLPMLESGETTLGDPTAISWGQTIYLGLRDAGFYPGWWVTVFPALGLVLTVLMFNVFGRVLGDVIDPRPD